MEDIANKFGKFMASTTFTELLEKEIHVCVCACARLGRGECKNSKERRGNKVGILVEDFESSKQLFYTGA